VAYEFNVQIRMADVWHVAGTFEAAQGAHWQRLSDDLGDRPKERRTRGAGGDQSRLFEASK